ncbi:MAG: hypothetical protein J6B31_02175 [Bacteroidaceae bacterium]|nr:hypothetical protein [Bacteroidaceae bacterium]
MKQRRYIAWMLMVVSMVMLTASVLPHHHHQEILCLQHDVEACECTSDCPKHHEHHQHEGHCSHSQHTCGSDCVTHFQIVAPDRSVEDVSPDFSFCSLLYTAADVLAVSLSLSDSKAKHSSYFLEKLHATCLPHVMGLRAPPAVL